MKGSVPFLDIWASTKNSFVRRSGRPVARELELNGRRYWILSEPNGQGWEAKVVEVGKTDQSDELGIEAKAETRVAADDAAERQLRRLVQDRR
jgi:hypothetical protein